MAPQPHTQEQRLDFLIRCLLKENEAYQSIEVPAAQGDKRRLLRSLMNVRPPAPASPSARPVPPPATAWTPTLPLCCVWESWA